MNNKFLNLNQDKQKVIRDAAVKEFALQGYDKASTDAIASEAGISKGSLFNYFTNKLTLYLYVLEYVMNRINREIHEEIMGIEESDFYDRLKRISLIRYQIFKKYPQEAHMLTTFFVAPPKESEQARDKLRRYYDFNNEMLQKYLLNYLEEEKLREGITKEEVLFITITLMEGFIKRYVENSVVEFHKEQSESDEKILNFDKYIEVLKYGVYKHTL